MVSYHYARQKTSALRLPMMVDSGGFASLFDNATVRAEDGLGFVTLFTDTGLEYLRPSEVLEFQEQHADVAFTLDFPIPPGTDAREAQHRQELTIANAKWAIENRRRRDLPIYGCIQGWNEASYLECAATLAEHAFDGLAIGGLVPRAHDSALVLRIVEGIRAIAPTVPLHVFGLGRPGLSRQLFEAGADSVDSSSYVKLAADGRSWSDPSLRLSGRRRQNDFIYALTNLAFATGTGVPLRMTQRRRTCEGPALSQGRVSSIALYPLSSLIRSASSSALHQISPTGPRVDPVTR